MAKRFWMVPEYDDHQTLSDVVVVDEQGNQASVSDPQGLAAMGVTVVVNGGGFLTAVEGLRVLEEES